MDKGKRPKVYVPRVYFPPHPFQPNLLRLLQSRRVPVLSGHQNDLEFQYVLGLGKFAIKLTKCFLLSFFFCLLKVFAGVYPVDQSEHIHLRSAIEKLTLNDASVSVHPDSWYTLFCCCCCCC